MTSDLPNQRNCSIKRLAFVKIPRTPELLLYNMQNVFKELQFIQCFKLELCTKGCVHLVNISLPTPPSQQALGKFTTSQHWKVSHQDVKAKLPCNKAETSGIFTSTSSCIYFIQLLYQ